MKDRLKFAATLIILIGLFASIVVGYESRILELETQVRYLKFDLEMMDKRLESEIADLHR